MKIYRLSERDGFFGLGVVLQLNKSAVIEAYCKGVLEYFHAKPSSLIAQDDIYLQYMHFICTAILSICFSEYQKGKELNEKYILKELENRELIVYDKDIILSIPSVPLLANIHFDLASSLASRYGKEQN